MSDPIRVLIAEGNPSIRQALERLLRYAAEVEVVGATSNAGSALRMAAQHRPAVALLSATLPPLDGRPLIPSLRQRIPQVRIVALGIYPSLRDEALDSGACRFLLLDVPRGEMLDAIREAAEGECQAANSSPLGAT